MGDQEVSQYLPTRVMCSNKLPERGFFFGVLATLRNDYLKEIIKGAHDKRYKTSEDNSSRSSILISDSWLDELKKHPYISSNYFG
jgi:hypothetical protein